MEILNASNLMSRAESAGDRARIAQLYPSNVALPGLLAVDLLEIEPGGSTSWLEHAEEHVLYVVSGECEISAAGGMAATLRANSVVYVGPGESHQLQNRGSERLRVLVSTPLLVRSGRALGIVPKSGTAATTSKPESSAARQAPPEQPSRIAERAPSEPVANGSQPAQGEEDEAPLPDISALMKRGSDIAATPRAERGARKAEPPRADVRPEPEPAEPEAEAEAEAEDEESEEAHRGLMELMVVFDGGSRGNPGQGYGSYLVQSPGRKPVVKRVEFGGNYTNNQAEYESLIACLQYITERLTATNRTPAQVALDIKSDSDLLVNQLQGTYKVKDAGLRQRHARALEMLDQFGEWMITWHEREESVRLLGH